MNLSAASLVGGLLERTIGAGGALVSQAERLLLGWPAAAALEPIQTRRLARAVEDRLIVLTGASSGIGREAALMLGGAGASLMLVARTQAQLEEVAEEVRRRGGTADVYPADLAGAQEAERVGREIVERRGGADVLVNNAGHSIRRSVEGSEERFHDFERTMQLNYFGALKLILALLPGMRARRDGQIVNVSTMGVNLSTPRFSAYIASKAALDGFSRSLAPEVQGEGIRVTTVHMPLVRTPMIEPTPIYSRMPALSAAQGARLLCGALIDRPRRVHVPLGLAAELAYTLAPANVDRIMSAGYRFVPESGAVGDAGDDAPRARRGAG